MGNCIICNKSDFEVKLFDGIYDGLVTKICYQCSLDEKIPLIKKPTMEQLREADRRRSVKEVMEKLSSPQKKLMMKDQIIAHKDLAKLRFPVAKQEHDNLVHNYDWLIKQTRRRMKISTTQLAERAKVEKVQVESLESGQLFNDFEKVAAALEPILNIKILKNSMPSFNRVKTHEEIKRIENDVLSSVKQKMKRNVFLFDNKPRKDDEEVEKGEIDLEEIKIEKEEERKKKHSDISEDIESGEFDFSKKENLDKITLHDLAELKKKREEKNNG